MSVGQGYETTDHHIKDKRTATGVTYGGMGQLMEIGCVKHIFNDQGKPKCYNWGQFGHIVRNCPKPRKVTCYNCSKEEHIAKDCRGPKKVKFTQKFKVRAIEGEESEEGESQGFDLTKERMNLRE